MGVCDAYGSYGYGSSLGILTFFADGWGDAGCFCWKRKVYSSIYKVLGQKFAYTQVQLPMMPALNLLDPHNHNLESLSIWHTS